MSDFTLFTDEMLTATIATMRRNIWEIVDLPFDVMVTKKNDKVCSPAASGGLLLAILQSLEVEAVSRGLDVESEPFGPSLTKIINEVVTSGE